MPNELTDFGLISYNTIENIADAIREKTNSEVNYYPSSMAMAIRQIRTGEGYLYPTIYSLKQYYAGQWDQTIINNNQMYDFEFRNAIIPGDSEIIGILNYGQLYSKNVIFYKRPLQNANEYAYGLCTESGEIYNMTSIIDMENLFVGCEHLNDAISGPYTMSMINTYRSCYNLAEANCGPNVQYMDNCYESCYNLTNAVCGNNVLTMRGTYLYCSNLNNGVSGPNVLDMRYAYNGCSNLIKLNIGPKVEDIQYVAAGCYNLVNVDGGNAVKNGYNAFAGCYNLERVNATFSELIDGSNMFYTCNNLETPGFLLGANKLQIANNMFQNCWSLTTGLIPDNVIETAGMYQNCYSLEFAIGGEHVINAYRMFENCYNLTNVIAFNVVENMYGAFENCYNLQIANVGAENAIQMAYCFNGCNNLLEPLFTPNANNMYMAYHNCHNLLNYYIPEGVNDISSTYKNCFNITGNVLIPENVSVIGNAFYMCEKVQDVVIFGNNIINQSWRTCNAFYRINYSMRRNIVLTNLTAFNNFVYCNGAGNFIKTNETYAEPVEINIENNSYNAVRCSYNTLYNCYIYCTE